LSLEEWTKLSTLCSESVLLETLDKADKLSAENLIRLLKFIAREAIPCNPKFRGFLKDVIRAVKGTDTAFNCLLTDKQLASIYKNARAKTQHNLLAKDPKPSKPSKVTELSDYGKALENEYSGSQIEALKKEIELLKGENKKLKAELKVEKFLSQGLTLKAEEAEKMLVQKDNTNRQLAGALETKELALKALRDRPTRGDRLASLKNGNLATK
jgi:predicted RNase H-like nuclease (RuvC/YqgF family)